MIWPSIIFDKSTLQSLNTNESVWFDNFYIWVITPTFFIETLADIEKISKSGRTPESVVGDIANKTPDNWYCMHINYRQLMLDELRWAKIELWFRPYSAWWKIVKTADWFWAMVLETPEELALKRWQNWEFIELEREYAKKWRRNLWNHTLHYTIELKQKILGSHFKPSSLEELKWFIDKIMNSPQDDSWIDICLSMGNIDEEIMSIFYSRWSADKKKILAKLAPYFSYVMTANLVFTLWSWLWLLEWLPHSETQYIDLSYIYYLPFSKLFVSHDKFHKRLVPVFLQEDQLFISGEDMKEDLAKLNTYYSSLPDEIKERGISTFATCPPESDEFLITRLWDKYMRKDWREIMKAWINPSISQNQEVLDKVRSFHDYAMEAEEVEWVAMENEGGVNELGIKRSVRYKKWDWKRFPPEVLDKDR
jgi:hypothetical protein